MITVNTWLHASRRLRLDSCNQIDYLELLAPKLTNPMKTVSGKSDKYETD